MAKFPSSPEPDRDPASAGDMGSYEAEEARYIGWQLKFVYRMASLQPGLSAVTMASLADEWYRYVSRLSPEEAAEIAAMWLQPSLMPAPEVH